MLRGYLSFSEPWLFDRSLIWQRTTNGIFMEITCQSIWISKPYFMATAIRCYRTPRRCKMMITFEKSLWLYYSARRRTDKNAKLLWSQTDDVNCEALLCGLQVNFCVLTLFWCLMDLLISLMHCWQHSGSIDCLSTTFIQIPNYHSIQLITTKVLISIVFKKKCVLYQNYFLLESKKKQDKK